jgi:hypothetical protein
MRKIVSWLLCGGNWRRPQSKLNGAESFDEDHLLLPDAAISASNRSNARPAGKRLSCANQEKGP